MKSPVADTISEVDYYTCSQCGKSVPKKELEDNSKYSIVDNTIYSDYDF